MNKKIKNIIIILLVLITIILAGAITYNKIKKMYKVEDVVEEKYLLLSSKNNVGVIDNKGNVIIEPQYFSVHIPNPSKPLFICYYDYNEQTKAYRTKVVNQNGTELFTKYNKVETIDLNEIETSMPYEKNVLKYEEKGKYGLIDLKGNVVTKAEYDSIDGLSNKEGELLISKEGKYGVINTSGAELIKPEYDFISGDEYYTNDKKYALSGYILGQKTADGYRYGYMNYKGKILLEVEYNDIIRLGGIGSEDTDKDVFLVAKKNGQCGLIKNKKVVLDFRYQSIDYSGVNNFFIVTRSTKTGVYNSLGKKIISVKYDSVQVHDNYIYTKLKDEEAYYNLNGNRIDKSSIKEDNEKSENQAEETSPSAKLIPIEKDGKWGFADGYSNVKVECKYEKVTEFNKNGFAGIKLNGKWGSINEKGEVIIEPIYNLDNFYEIDFIGKYYKVVYDYKTVYYSDNI